MTGRNCGKMRKGWEGKMEGDPKIAVINGPQ
jgi:hypothetical protein